jgi:hypothetical protein
MIHTDEIHEMTLPVYPSQRTTLREELENIILDIENKN